MSESKITKPNQQTKQIEEKWRSNAEFNYQTKVIAPNKELIVSRFSHLLDLEKLGVIETSRPTSRASSVVFPEMDLENPTIGSSLVSTASTGFSERNF